MNSGDLPRIFVLEYAGRPWNTNAERASNRWERARLTKIWRESFWAQAKAQRIPRLSAVNVIVQPWQAKGNLADTAACNPSVKAAIDGLVDAGVIENDTGEFVQQITFMPVKKGKNALVLTLHEIAR